MKRSDVPIKTLFEYLEDNYSLEEFVECFPSVTAEMARFITSDQNKLKFWRRGRGFFAN